MIFIFATNFIFTMWLAQSRYSVGICGMNELYREKKGRMEAGKSHLEGKYWLWMAEKATAASRHPPTEVPSTGTEGAASARRYLLSAKKDNGNVPGGAVQNQLQPPWPSFFSNHWGPSNLRAFVHAGPLPGSFPTPCFTGCFSPLDHQEQHWPTHWRGAFPWPSVLFLQNLRDQSGLDKYCVSYDSLELQDSWIWGPLLCPQHLHSEYLWEGQIRENEL